MITLNNAEQITQEIKKGIINWIPFKPLSAILLIGNSDAIYEELTIYSTRITTIIDFAKINEDWIDYHSKYFDYIIVTPEIEKYFNLSTLFSAFKKILKYDGHLILLMNNRIGIRYFCGDRDIYTNHSFDGIDGYCRSYSTKQDIFNGRTYDKYEITELLKKSGWVNIKFFSVFSDLDNPSLVFSDNYFPNEDLSTRIAPTYIHPDSVFLEEETLYQTLINNGMFHTMANAFIIDCTIDNEPFDVNFVASSMERGNKFAMLTIIHSNGIVEKKAAYDEGIYRLKNIVDNLKNISEHGLSVVNATLENNILKMPYIDAEVGQLYLKKLLYSDKEKFISSMDHFRDLILHSSEIISDDKGDGEGAVLKKGYIDLVPLNSFYINGEFAFYDQEFCEEKYPANAIIWRMLGTFYAGNPDFKNIIPIDFFLKRYNLNRQRKKWQKLDWDFITELRSEKILKVYHEKCRRNIETVNSNRQRINYSDAEYQRLFVNIFDKIDNKKIILFGSGNFTKRFIAMYSKEYPIHAIVDNNSEKWGQILDGIKIVSPEILKKISEDEYKIIICIKKFNSVAKQLDELGFNNYSIFDTGRSYLKPQKMTFVADNNKSAEKKKYHIGYVAGVFDMFHIGHINILRRAKELCDYLIIGVVPDKGVFEQKNKYPIIPCEERVEVVQSCRYVDKAEELPLECRSIRDAYKMYKFDCMFTGTDYADNPDWLADREYLRKNGADIVFFPYTEKTSSTKIREKLNQTEENQ